MDQLNEKLAELEEERKELAEFQRLDKQRRALEFAIYDRDLSSTKAALEKVNTACKRDTFLMSLHVVSIETERV